MLVLAAAGAGAVTTLSSRDVPARKSIDMAAARSVMGLGAVRRIPWLPLEACGVLVAHACSDVRALRGLEAAGSVAAAVLSSGGCLHMFVSDAASVTASANESVGGYDACAKIGENVSGPRQPGCQRSEVVRGYGGSE